MDNAVQRIPNDVTRNEQDKREKNQPDANIDEKIALVYFAFQAAGIAERIRGDAAVGIRDIVIAFRALCTRCAAVGAGLYAVVILLAAIGADPVLTADADGAFSGNLIDEFIRAVIIQIKLDIPVSCLAAVRAFLMVAADFLCAAVTAVPVSPAIALFAAGRAFDQITADIRPVTLRAVPV